jgi:Golgi nucleoside diphosphatase
MLLTVLVVAIFSLTYAEDYAVIIDAGSTGSRSFIFQFSSDPVSGTRRVATVNSMKVTPGLSSFGSNPEDVVSYMAPLLYNAANVIDKKHHAKTKIYIKATAGMRLIPENEQANIWESLITGLINDENIPFHIAPTDFGTIDGYYEAYYAVLASNYIAGRIDGDLRRIKGKNMVGAMDMGGSSTQLIFYNGSHEDGIVTAEDFWYT